jgi:hypothetical protein
MSEWGYIALAYGVAWTTLVGYGLYLARRTAAASAEWRRASAGKGGTQ